MKNTSAPRLLGDPLHLECGDGRVVNVVVTADGEDSFFVVGCSNGFFDPGLNLSRVSDFLKTDIKTFAVQIFHVFRKGKECGLSSGAEVDVIRYDHPYATGCKHMLPIENGVINKILLAVDGVGDKDTLKHNDMPVNFSVCEGFKTAKALARWHNAKLSRPLERSGSGSA